MTDATAAPVPPAKPGVEDLFEIYYAPSKVFERRKGGEFGLPLVALAVIGGVLMFATKGLLAPVFEAETAAGMAKAAAQMTPEQLQKAKSFAATATTIGIPITYLIAPFILGAVAWLVAMVAGVKVRYTVAVMIATFSWYPRLLEWVVSAVQMVVFPDTTSRLGLSLGVGRFIDSSHPTVLGAVVGRIDLFTIWCTVLLALGFKVTGRATRNQAIAIGVIVWIVGALLPLWGAIRAS